MRTDLKVLFSLNNFLLWTYTSHGKRHSEHCPNLALWLVHIDRDRGWDRYKDQVESLVPCQNVHTGRRKGQGPEPIVFLLYQSRSLYQSHVLFPCGVPLMSTLICNNFVDAIFTARKRCLRRLCFHRCLSVHGGDVSVRGGLCQGVSVSSYMRAVRILLECTLVKL